MSTFIDNMPVAFGYGTDPCATPAPKYVQIVDVSDKTPVQFKIEPCSICFGYEDVDFDTDVWSYDGSKWCKATDGSPDTLTFNFGSAYAGEYLSFTFVINNITGSATITYAGDNFSGTLGTITGSGTYTYYLYGDTNLNIIINPTEGTNICVSDIETPCVKIYNVNYQIQIKDSNSNLINTINLGGSYFYNGYMTFEIDWAELGITSGCHYLCVINPCENEEFGEKLLPASWSVSEEEATTNIITSPTIGFTVTGTGSNPYVVLTQLPNLISGKCYRLSFEIYDDEAPSATMKVRVVTDGYTSGYHYDVGVHTFDFNYTGGGLSLQFLKHNGSPHDITLINMSLIVREECYTCECCSNMFQIGSYDCTHLIQACNDRNAFGANFSFGSTSLTYVPQIRLKSKLVRGRYSTNRESFEDSIGDKNTIYFKRRKSREFRVDPAVAEYVHDFLSTLAGYDHVYIDGVEYFIDDDDYNVSYPNRNDVEAIVSINVSEKIQLVENKACGSTSENCGDNIATPTNNCNC